MADTYEAFYNGKPLNPNRGLPTMTYAQAEDCGLTESERLWCRTDGEDTPITADDIPYSTGVSVKDKIDELVKCNTVKTAGVITINGTVNIPSTAKNIYICINVNNYVVSPLLKIALHSRYSVPWGYLTWLAIFEFSYLNNVLTFVSENTVAGTKSGGWTTKIEVYYTE